MPMRPASSTCSALMNPCPSAPSSCARRHAAVLEDHLARLAGAHPELVFLLARRGTRACPRSTMNAEMPRLPLPRVRHRHDHDQVAGPAVGDELLGAVDAPSRRRRARPSSASPPRRCPTRPRSAPTPPAARRAPAAPGSAASAPRCRTWRCARRRGRCARRPTGRPTDRRAPAPRCRCSSPPTTSPRRRIPRGTECPSARARRTSASSSRGNCCASSHSLTCGRSSASANSRTLRRSSS